MGLLYHKELWARSGRGELGVRISHFASSAVKFSFFYRKDAKFSQRTRGVQFHAVYNIDIDTDLKIIPHTDSNFAFPRVGDERVLLAHSVEVLQADSE